jgi:endonuclease III
MHAIAVRDLLVEQAHARLAQPARPLVFTGNEVADALLNDLSGFPHVFLIACICDRQMKAETAWLVPFALGQRIGGRFDFASLAALSVDDLTRLFAEPTPIHRLRLQMPVLVHAAMERVARDYSGDAGAIWSGRPSSAAVICRLLEFRGVGPKIATMTANILARDFRVPFADKYSIDISVDVHVKRVFARLGLITLEGTEEQVNLRVIYQARALYPEYPGIFDFALWELGRNVCKASDPRCGVCQLRQLCPSAGKVAS